jgi:hypothetical protein
VGQSRSCFYLGQPAGKSFSTVVHCRQYFEGKFLHKLQIKCSAVVQQTKNKKFFYDGAKNSCRILVKVLEQTNSDNFVAHAHFIRIQGATSFDPTWANVAFVAVTVIIKLQQRSNRDQLASLAS